jgi:ABC-type uncharacterized transport system permease subunit
MGSATDRPLTLGHFQDTRLGQRVISGTLAAIVTVGLFGGFLLVAGRNPFTTIWGVVAGAFGSSLGLKETLVRATPILLCALAAAVPARAGLLNIGAEGQLHAGAIAATWVVLFCGGAPGIVLIPAMMLAAIALGGVWAFIPGMLRSRWGVNEALATLMLNYVAILWCSHLVHGSWKDPKALGWPYSQRFPDTAILPTFGGSSIHLGLLLGVIAAVVLFVLLRFTSWGLAVRIIEANPTAAKYAGIRQEVYIPVVMIIGGSLAGLAGLGEASVIQGRLRPDMSPGYGYTGFLIAWLAGHDPLKAIPIAVLMGGIYSGADALQLQVGLPGSVTDILVGILLLASLSSKSLTERLFPAHSPKVRA